MHSPLVTRCNPALPALFVLVATPAFAQTTPQNTYDPRLAFAR
jgi:hypothetical protein